MSFTPHLLRVAVLLSVTTLPVSAQPLVLEPGLVHLRSGADREWSTFPAQASGATWTHRFTSAGSATDQTLCLRQQDVKQDWRVLLNGEPLGQLARDENDTRICLPVPAARLVAGGNDLRVEPATQAGASDDIRLGEVTLDARPIAVVLGEATLDLVVTDADGGAPLPARFTIVDAAGALVMTGASSRGHLAVRPGVVYTANGTARVPLPAGAYTVYAGRGFEYSLAQTEVALAPGETIARQLTLRREVPMPGYVSSDTHVHTFTHSGHGDATIDERMITIAAEGIQLPIATDHNTHIDYEPHAVAMGVRQHFTPVTGNEVTTPTGHFNIFPVDAGAPVPDASSTDWGATFDAIFGTSSVRAAILNHARDVHRGTRPFDPALHHAVAGVNLDGWPMRFTAMEVINSGATQTDPLRLTHDWMGLLNHGYHVTPVGSSDSHDVTRYIVGQGRTYIRGDDRDPGAIDVDAVVRNFAAGHVLVSYGLVAELTVNGRHGPGDFVRDGGDALQIDLRVLAPDWVTPTHVRLYANGTLVREEAVGDARDDLPRGVQWQARWQVPRPPHDVHLVAVALGEGVDGPWWPMGKAYQPTSPVWEARALGVSGAVWIDGDLDGIRSPARDYAVRLYVDSRGDLARLVPALAGYDTAVAVQAAHLYRSSGGSLDSAAFQQALASGGPAVQAGFRAYLDAWREHERTRTAAR